MEFEWDPRKAGLNVVKHGIDFADAMTVLYDELALTAPDDHPLEERYITLEMDALGRILIVVYTWRGNRIRIISARKATARERRQYRGAR